MDVCIKNEKYAKEISRINLKGAVHCDAIYETKIQQEPGSLLLLQEGPPRADQGKAIGACAERLSRIGAAFVNCGASEIYSKPPQIDWKHTSKSVSALVCQNATIFVLNYLSICYEDRTRFSEKLERLSYDDVTCVLDDLVVHSKKSQQPFTLDSNCSFGGGKFDCQQYHITTQHHMICLKLSKQSERMQAATSQTDLINVIKRMDDDVVEQLFKSSFNDSTTVHIKGILLENRSVKRPRALD